MTEEIYWLQVATDVNSPTRYDGMFLRFAGSGSPAVVLTKEPPKYLRSHIDDAGHHFFTSWKHTNRIWSFRLAEKEKLDPSFDNRPMWSPLEIHEEPGADDGFTFQGNPEKLVNLRAKGWIVCDWAYGHPQLFYLTEAFDETKELPGFCQRVQLIKAKVVGQGE